MNDSIKFHGKVLSMVNLAQRKHVEKGLLAIGHTTEWIEAGWDVAPFGSASDAKGPPIYWSFTAQDQAQTQAIKAWLQENPYQSATP